ncbi:MAG: cell division protein FtsZ [Bacteroidales bacterium]|nr:cell division protein FtsZ [Bacteroidales bacterium]MCB9012985.1 cell division protein FtsZ [Bacteroidales bacterium]
MFEDLNFELPVERSSIIKVLGVGGGGSNAVNHMAANGIRDVNFVVCNTDAQALQNSPVAVKIQLGESLTEGRGAGSKPDIGRKAAMESMDTIKEVLSGNTRMVFITAGMGGGTGTGAAPVIAKAARELGLLTVAIVTIPFRFEGQQRIEQAIQGLNELQQYVDSLLVINNEKLREVFGDLKLSEAFSRADDVLATAAKGIAEIITVHGYINVDFADVETVMKDSGVAIMGSASASGEGRAIKAIEKALASPLLNNNDITGAKSILLNITSGEEEISMDEVGEITDFVHQSADRNALIIWGTSQDVKLGDAVSVTVIATGFETNSIPELYAVRKNFDKIPLRDGYTAESSGQTASGFEIKDSDSADPVVQTSIEFIIRDEENNGQYALFEDKQARKKDGEVDSRKREERVKKLKETHEKLKEEGYNGITANDKIEELENQPAYIRKKIKLEDEGTRPSADNPVSRYSLSDDEDNVPRLRDDNSYLHDNVD